MTQLLVRILLALGLLPARAHPPIPPLRRSLLSIHVLNTTYPRSIDK